MKFSKSLALCLAASLMIMSFSSCSMFKKRKCNKCPKFTEVEYEKDVIRAQTEFTDCEEI